MERCILLVIPWNTFTMYRPLNIEFTKYSVIRNRDTFIGRSLITWWKWNQTVKMLYSLWQVTLYVHCHFSRKWGKNVMFHSRSLSYDRSIAPSKVSSADWELLPSVSIYSNFSFPYCYLVAAYEIIPRSPVTSTIRSTFPKRICFRRQSLYNMWQSQIIYCLN